MWLVTYVDEVGSVLACHTKTKIPPKTCVFFDDLSKTTNTGSLLRTMETGKTHLLYIQTLPKQFTQTDSAARQPGRDKQWWYHCNVCALL